MKAKDIQIGGRYLATVSRKRTTVRILDAHDYHRSLNSRARKSTHWRAVNEATGHHILIHSAQRLSPLPLARQYDEGSTMGGIGLMGPTR